MSIEVSVIIPTCNRAESLRSCLESLKNQTFPGDSFEVIVVDNGSVDSTQMVCESQERNFANFRYVLQLSPGLHAARNSGIDAATADCLLYTDDDTETFTTWVEASFACLRNSGYGLVTGKVLPRFGAVPPGWIQKKISSPQGFLFPALSLLDLGDQKKMISPYYIWGCNFGVTRNLLMDAGGFHPDALPGELRLFRGDGEIWIGDIAETHGVAAWYEPRAGVYHCIPERRLTQEYMIERHYLQGISDSYTCCRARYRKTPAATRKRARRIRLLCAVKRVLLLWPLRMLLPRRRRKEVSASIQGYADHNKAVATQPSLKAWVTRDDYRRVELNEFEK